MNRKLIDGKRIDKLNDLRIFLTLLAVLAVSNCQTPDENISLQVSTNSLPTEPARVEPGSAPWTSLGVKEAMDQAVKQNRPLLLYWGAAWCPPCNEIKSEVFSKRRFVEIMSPMTAVYLDGDAENAQIWAEKLSISGYPTILVFDGTGHEVMRIDTSVNLQEFEAALTAALEVRGSFASILQRAIANQASKSDWRLLAYHSWSQTHTDIKLTISDLERLTDNAPNSMGIEKSLLAGRLLTKAAGANEAGQDRDKSAQDVRDRASALLELIFANALTIKANRSTILYETDILHWAFEDENILKAWEVRWIAAAKILQNDASLSVDTRLWAAYPQLKIWKTHHEKKPIDERIKEAIKSAAIQANEDAKTDYERHAVISGAAYLLRQIKDYDAARRLLNVEISTSKTPWYYQSSMAALEREAGNEAAALHWSERARRSAKGRATKIQWIVNDIDMAARVKDDDSRSRLKNVLKIYYDTAFSYEDGFAGRNASRAARVAKAVKPMMGDAGLRDVVASFSSKCSTLPRKSRSACKEHFAFLKM